jgi:hypothetical protein
VHAVEEAFTVDPIPVVVDDDHRQHDPPFELNAGQRVAPVYERPERIDAIRGAHRSRPSTRN